MIFFGYTAARRACAEVMHSTATTLMHKHGIATKLWQDLAVDGLVIVDRVLDEIDDAELCIFDLTDQSENVLFEAGYAISKAKRVWLTIDTTIGYAKGQWQELAILNPIGYTPYHNSKDLIARFQDLRPLSSSETTYDDLIDPALPDNQHPESLLYCSTFEPFEAADRLSHFLDNRRQRGLRVIVSDPRESTLDSITWFAPRIVQSAGVLVHFAGRHRNRASLHNRRHAFTAGMARGFNVPLLMLAEEDYFVPFDYQTMLNQYETSEECISLAREWLDSLTIRGVDWKSPRAASRSVLSGLRFGEHVAENELSELTDYFVETSAYQDVIAARDAIFIGHRGTGKTANATQAFEYITANKMNMAVLIKPPGFEFPALFSIIEKMKDAQREYFLDSMWRFIVETEIAAEIYARINDRPPSIPRNKAEQSFVTFAKSAPFDVSQDISVRLEQVLRYLGDHLPDDPVWIGQRTRDLIHEAFHSESLADLRRELGPVLKDKKRVAVFVDNLDKGWKADANLQQAARLILGLLTARGRVVRDFNKQDWYRDRVKLTVAIFLRSDIYQYLREEAREPDKLPVSMIAWRDPETLLTIIETRFEVSATGAHHASDLWNVFFCPQVGGLATKDFITSVVLPRPRDVVYFCNLAVGRALDRRHTRVEPDDFLSAERTYSQWAYEALLVENGVTIPEMKDALFGFLGAPELITRRQAYECLASAGLPSDRHEAILRKLVLVSFLGIEIRPNEYTYPEVGTEMRRADAQSARLVTAAGSQRFRIHRAYHSFLDITET